MGILMSDNVTELEELWFELSGGLVSGGCSDKAIPSLSNDDGKVDHFGGYNKSVFNHIVLRILYMR